MENTATTDAGGAVAIPTSVRAFLVVRRTQMLLLVTAGCGALTAWLGTYETSLPSLTEQGRAIIPLWRMLAIGAAVAPAVSLYSRLADLEVVATRQFHKYQRAYLVVVGLTCGFIYLGIAAITLPSSVLIISLRAWLAWYGLALIAGRVLGWRLAWTAPITTAIILWYWGFQGAGQYRWWEFSARPYDDVPSALLSSALLASGLAAYWTTPWRWWRLLRCGR